MANTRYEADRDKLLARIHRQLLADERIVAAWLTGSLGRGEADAISDIDLTVVVSNHAAGRLCEREWMTGASAPPERLALVSASGQPAVIHENHFNAPVPGTFTSVVYAESCVNVDWTLVPEDEASRPRDSKLLFERRSIPLWPKLSLPEPAMRDQLIADRAAFFWMMIPQAIKSLSRGDLVHFHILVHLLERTRNDLAALIHEQPRRYRKGSKLSLSRTRQQGKDLILSLCHEVIALVNEIEGGSDLDGVSEDPMPVINRLLQMLDEGADPE